MHVNCSHLLVAPLVIIIINERPLLCNLRANRHLVVMVVT